MQKEESSIVKLPIIDLSAPGRFSTAATLRQACIEVGFFYIVNHGVDKDLLKRLFEESNKFFSLPLEEKMRLNRKEHRGYTALYSEKLDPSLNTQGDPKESFYIGPLHGEVSDLNQWPSEELLPNWRQVMETYQSQVLRAGKNLLSLLALALKLDENYFENVGALDPPMPFLRLIHYPGGLSGQTDEVLGASAHSDYGMITLLATDGVPGLQVCRDKDHEPRIWEDVLDIEGALIVNIGDMTERLTNCLFRSTLHRVVPKGQERYSCSNVLCEYVTDSTKIVGYLGTDRLRVSENINWTLGPLTVAFFLDPRNEFLVKCLETACSESNPPRFPPVRYIHYLRERFRLTFGSDQQAS